MKKITGLFTALFIVVALTAPGMAAQAAGGFDASGATAFTISGNETMINTKTMSDSGAVSALVKLLAEARTPSPAPANAVETAKIDVTRSGGTVQYTILADKNGLYAKSGDKTLAISADAFHKTMNAFGYELYRYRAMPRLSFKPDGGDTVTARIESSTYGFKKLDNKFYRPYYEPESGAAPALKTDSQWPSLSFTLKPDFYGTDVYAAGKTQPVFSGAFDKAGEYIQKNSGTDYTLKIIASYKDSADALYRGDVVYTLSVGKETKKTEDFSIEGNNTYPGEVVVLRVNNYNDGEKITFKSGIDFTPNFFDDGDGGKIALLPVSYFTAVGQQSITLSCGGRSASWTVSVRDKKFQIQNLTVDSATTNATVNSAKANQEYVDAIAPLRPVADSKKYWDDFVWPVTGPVSTEFGMIRYVNGSPTSERHGAIDFAVPKGTTVKATAAGRVLYSGFLQLTGNTVLIEHGYGLKSWYYHMDSLNTKTGDMVQAGQKIGEVGSTGFSTGAHLHFGMSVNNVFINPTTVIDTDLIKNIK
jgi:hypothetical protein